MARLFPFRSDAETGERTPRVVDIEDDCADEVFDALSSSTAREIYATLDEQPSTASDVAEAVDSSIQNVRYHLGNLEDADLIEVVDTWYSSRGNEMSVYATANGPLIVAGDRSTAERLKDTLARYLGGIAVLAGGSALAYYGLEQLREAIPGAAVDDADDEDATVPVDDDDAEANGDTEQTADAEDDDGNGDDDHENGADGAEDDVEHGDHEEDDGNGDDAIEESDGVGNETGDGNGAGPGNDSASTGAVDTAEVSWTVDGSTGRDSAFEFGGGNGELLASAAGDGFGTAGPSAVAPAPEAIGTTVAAVPPGLLLPLGSAGALAAAVGYAYLRAG